MREVYLIKQKTKNPKERKKRGEKKKKVEIKILIPHVRVKAMFNITHYGSKPYTYLSSRFMTYIMGCPSKKVGKGLREEG